MLTHKKDTLPVSFCRTLPFAQRVFFGTQIDQHSDLKAQGLVTVMAVAADLHRNFLTPVRKKRTVSGLLPTVCAILLLIHGLPVCLHYNTKKCFLQALFHFL